MEYSAAETRISERVVAAETEIRNLKEILFPELKEIKALIHANHESIQITLGNAARLDREQAAAQVERINKQFIDLWKEERAERQRQIAEQAQVTDRAIAALRDASKEAESRNAPVRSLVDRWGGGLALAAILATLLLGLAIFAIRWGVTGTP